MATSKLKADFSNLQTGARVTPGAPLFAQIEVDGGASAALAKEKKKKVVSKKPEAFVDELAREGERHPTGPHPLSP